MLVILLGLFQLIWLFGRGHHAVVLENLVLRQQLVIYKRKKKCPRLVGRDGWFWIALSAVWKDWRRPLFVVHPDTVVRWQRERFRRHWAQRSKKSGRRGRPRISRQVREVIRTIACANPLWRAPRIHGELRKLGIEVSERTVSRVLRTVKRPPSQTWKTFLQNHIGGDRRHRLLHRTDDPPAGSVRVSRAGASAEEGASFRSYGTSERRMGRAAGGGSLRGAGIQAVLGPRPRCDLWPRVSASNPVVGHEGYHRSRTHLALAKDAPESRAIMSRGEIVAIPQVGGLHRRYERRAA
jgi:putative transposase